MSEWIDRLVRLAALSERVGTLTDSVKALAGRVEDHQTRLIRLETIVEIVRRDGAVLRLGRE